MDMQHSSKLALEQGSHGISILWNILINSGTLSKDPIGLSKQQDKDQIHFYSQRSTASLHGSPHEDCTCWAAEGSPGTT